MTLRRQSWLYITLCITAFLACLLFISNILNQAKELQSKGIEQVEMTNEKLVKLNFLLRQFGYDGFIHHFKNYVLRRDPIYLADAQQAMQQTMTTYQQLMTYPLSAKEKQALTALGTIINNYQTKLNGITHQKAQSLSSQQLDKQVKVDDSLARLNIKTLIHAISLNSQSAYLDLENGFQVMQHFIYLYGSGLLLLLAITGLFLLRTHLKLAQNLAILLNTKRSLPDVFVLTDEHGKIIQVNPQFESQFGYSEQEACQLSVEDLIPKANRERHIKHRQGFISQPVNTKIINMGSNIKGLRKNQSTFPIEVHLASFLVSKQRYSLAIVKDLTETERLKKMASRDSLTRLLNKHGFQQVFDLEWHRARRYRRPLSLIICDIDDFKIINDQHGHDVGDKILQQIAAFLKKRLRNTDYAARWGGEEFAILLVETNLMTANLFAKELVQDLYNRRFANNLTVTFSAGVAEYDLNNIDDSAKSLFKRADEALYQAKKEGKNRCCISTFRQ